MRAPLPTRGTAGARVGVETDGETADNGDAAGNEGGGTDKRGDKATGEDKISSIEGDGSSTAGDIDGDADPEGDKSWSINDETESSETGGNAGVDC